MNRLLRALTIGLLAALAGHLCVFGILILGRSLIGLPAMGSSRDGAGRNEVVELAITFAPVTAPMALLAALFLIWRTANLFAALAPFSRPARCSAGFFQPSMWSSIWSSC